MKYEVFHSKQFLKDLRDLQKNNHNKIKLIKKIILLIQTNPFSKRLHIKKLNGEKQTYRYKVGRDIRILIEFKEKKIIFLKIRKR